MKEKNTSIFLKLMYTSKKQGKEPLLNYIQEFDDNIPMYIYSVHDLGRKVEKKYKHIDFLFLDELAVVNTIFLFQYLLHLQSLDTYMDISIQSIIELSLLEDEDEKPDCEVFENAYLSDTAKRRIVRNRKYNFCKVLSLLNPIDLEFYRRLVECTFNSQIETKDFFLLDNEKSLNNPFIDYKNSIISSKVTSFINHIKEKKDANGQFLNTIKAPEDVYFDGERLTFLDKDSPVSLIFNVNRNNKRYNVGGRKIENHYSTEIIGGINVEHPSTVTLAYQTYYTGKSLKKIGKNSYDFSWSNVLHEAINELSNHSSRTNRKVLIEKLKRIQLMLELKNGNSKNSKNLIDSIKEHSLRVVDIDTKYDDPMNDFVKLATQLITSTDKGIMVVFDTSSGYIKVEITKSKLNKVRKLESKATFYNHNNDEVMNVSPYFEDIITEKDKSDILGQKQGAYRKSYGGYVAYIETCFSRFFEFSTPILVDYNGHLDFERLKTIELDVRESNHVKSSVLSSPPNVVNNRVECLFRVNNISTYVFWLKRVREKGYVPTVEYLNKLNTLYGKMGVFDSLNIEVEEILLENFEDLWYSYQNHPRVIFSFSIKQKGKTEYLDSNKYSIIEKPVEFKKVYNN